MKTLFHRLAVAVLVLAGLAGQAIAAPHAPVPAVPGPALLEPAAGRFLVASRSLQDPHFARTVVYLLQHDEQGTLGLVINRTLGITLGEALPGNELPHLGDSRLSYGGPVSVRHIIMLLRDDAAPSQAIHITDGIYASNNMDLLRELDAANKPAGELRLFAGHAGWSAGQLQQELDRDDWFVVPGETAPVFDTTGRRLWERLIERLDPAGIYVRDLPPAAPRAGL
jgi:putative transcriptional regulator